MPLAGDAISGYALAGCTFRGYALPDYAIGISGRLQRRLPTQCAKPLLRL